MDKNSLGFENFKFYFVNLNYLPSDRSTSEEQFKGRKTIQDSFNFACKKDKSTENTYSENKQSKSESFSS